MLKKVFSHSAIYGLAPQLPRIVNLLVYPIITKYLTADDFGVYGVITAVTGAFGIFTSLGLTVTLTNSFYKSPCSYKWGWRQVYGFLILWNIPFALILGAILYFFIPEIAKEHTLLIILLNTIPVFFFGPTSTVGSIFYQLNQQPIQIGFRSAVVGILTIILNILFIVHYKMGYLGWFLAGGISQMILQASYWVPINLKYKIRPIFNFKWRYIKEQLKVGLPTVPHYYGSYLLNSFDKVLMNLLHVPTADIGKYNAAGTIAHNGEAVGVAVGRAISPMLMSFYKNKEEQKARYLIFILQTIFLVGSFTISLWMKEIFKVLMKNETLQMVYPMAVIIIMGYNYRPMYFGSVSKLFFQENTSKLMKITLIAGLISVTLNLIFIPIFGYQAAAYIIFLGLMFMGYSGFFLKEYKQTATLNYYPMHWLSLTILLTTAAYVLVEMNYILKLLICIVVLIFFFFIIINLNEKLNE